MSTRNLKEINFFGKHEMGGAGGISTIALPESFPNLYAPDKLLQLFTDRFKEKYGVECVSALHHNKRKTNYHIHLIFSERELLPEPIEKLPHAICSMTKTGNMYAPRKRYLTKTGMYAKAVRL